MVEEQKNLRYKMLLASRVIDDKEVEQCPVCGRYRVETKGGALWISYEPPEDLREKFSGNIVELYCPGDSGFDGTSPLKR